LRARRTSGRGLRGQAGLAAALIVGLVAMTQSPASAAPPHRQLVERAGEITEATALVSDPSAPNLLYVSQRDGKIYTLEDSEANLLVDLSPLVAPVGDNHRGEEALSSIVLDPGFSTNHGLYVAYPSQAEPGNIRVEELTVSGDPATILASRRLVIAIPHGASSHHFGGQLQFGPDGYLYISTGDGYPPPPYPTSSPAQDLDSLLGKLLRIDPEDPDGAGPATYSIPLDSPFAGQVGARGEIWSLGFRNPFRFSFDRAGGDLVIGDVGQDAAEEINWADSPGPGEVGGAGLDYGWPCREGDAPYVGTVGPPGCPASPRAFTDPVFLYPHDGPESGCAVIGGYVVRDPTLGDLAGRYLYGDFCTGEIKSLLGASSRLEPALDLEGGFELESFGEDACGRQYVLAEDVYRIEGDAPASCGRLRVTVSGDGSVGGAGIACPGSCERLFTADDPLGAVSLVPAPAPGWRFAGWEGACGGLGQCSTVVDRERDVSAKFVPLTAPEAPAPTPGPSRLPRPSPPAGEGPGVSARLSVGRFVAHPRTGTGTLTVGVTVPGTVVLSARGIARVSKHLGAGKGRLTIAAVGRKRRILAASGELAVTVKVAYRSNRGEAVARFRRVTLRANG
jgi:glucose/arabinose dehydrogenase